MIKTIISLNPWRGFGEVDKNVSKISQNQTKKSQGDYSLTLRTLKISLNYVQNMRS